MNKSLKRSEQSSQNETYFKIFEKILYVKIIDHS